LSKVVRRRFIPTAQTLVPDPVGTIFISSDERRWRKYRERYLTLPSRTGSNLSCGVYCTVYLWCRYTDIKQDLEDELQGIREEGAALENVSFQSPLKEKNEIYKGFLLQDCGSGPFFFF
jgi:hypothetical protein